MTARQSRLDIIKAIIQTQEIGSQEELAQALSKEGVNMTQATLTRDLKLLKVVQGFSPKGRSIYMLPENPYYRRVREHRQEGTAIRNGFMSVKFSGQLAVIKCRPGYASGLASDIDNAHFPEVIGTIAGDDTALLVMKDNASAITLYHEIEEII